MDERLDIELSFSLPTVDHLLDIDVNRFQLLHELLVL